MKKQILASIVCLITSSLALAGDYHDRTTTTDTTTTDTTTTNTTYTDPNMNYQNQPVYPTTMQEARSMSEIPSEQRTIY